MKEFKISDILLIFVIGFTFFISVFNKQIARYYLIFLIVSFLYIGFIEWLFKKIKKKKEQDKW